MAASLPDGFVLDQGPTAPPPGYELDQPASDGNASAAPQPNAPPTSFLGSIAKGIESVPAVLERAAGGALRAIGEAGPPSLQDVNPAMGGENDPQQPDLTEARADAAKSASVPGTPAYLGKHLFDAATQDLKANAPNVAPGSLNDYAYQITQGLASLAPVLGVAALTKSPVAAGALIAGQSYAEKYGEARESDRTPDQASMDAGFTGMVNGAMATLPIGVLMKPGGAFLGKALTSAGAFTFQGVATQALQMGYDKGVIGTDMTVAKAIPILMQTGIVSAATGLVLGTGEHAASKFVNRNIPGAKPPPASGDADAGAVDITTGQAGADTPQLAAPIDPQDVAPGDDESPIPTNIIAAGRKMVREATGESAQPTDTNPILARNGWPQPGTPVTLNDGEGPAATGTVHSGFNTEVPDSGGATADGLHVTLDTGEMFSGFKHEIDAAGIKITPQQAQQAGLPLNLATPPTNQPQAQADTATPTPASTVVTPEPVPAQAPSQPISTEPPAIQPKPADLSAPTSADTPPAPPDVGTVPVAPTPAPIETAEPPPPVQSQPVPPPATASAAVTPPAAEPAPQATLPASLAGAAPRYAYGSKQFTLSFDSDIDKAAYIAAQKLPSKQDAAFVSFVSNATGMDEAAVRAHGAAVRDAIKVQAKDAAPGTLTIPEVAQPTTGDGTQAAPIVVTHPDHVEQASELVNAAPSEAQADAGNYQKLHLKVQGLPITIENPKGSVRSGTDADGKPWQTTLPAAYGYIKRSTAADGDHVDVYVGPNPTSPKVFVIDQHDAQTGAYDEAKSFVGFDTRQQVLDTYHAAFSDGLGPQRMGGVREMNTLQFKKLLNSGTLDKPITGKPLPAVTAPELPKPAQISNSTPPDAVKTPELQSATPMQALAAKMADARAQQATSDPTKTPLSKMSIADKLAQKKPLKESERQALYTAYFAPGRTVEGYGGKDVVTQAPTFQPNGNWQVGVRGLAKDGVTLERERFHSTAPSRQALLEVARSPEFQAANPVTITKTVRAGFHDEVRKGADNLTPEEAGANPNHAAAQPVSRGTGETDSGPRQGGEGLASVSSGAGGEPETGQPAQSDTGEAPAAEHGDEGLKQALAPTADLPAGHLTQADEGGTTDAKPSMNEAFDTLIAATAKHLGWEGEPTSKAMFAKALMTPKGSAKTELYRNAGIIKTMEEQRATPLRPSAAATIKGTGETKTRGLSEGIADKAGIDADLPEYATMKKADQLAKATQYDANPDNRATSEAAAMGTETPPLGISPEAMLIAVENRAAREGDADLLLRLATKSKLVSEATEMGQRISMLGERDPLSPVSAVKEVQSARQAAAKDAGTNTSRAKKDAVKDMLKEANKRPDASVGAKKLKLQAFINAVICKE